MARDLACGRSTKLLPSRNTGKSVCQGVTGDVASGIFELLFSFSSPFPSQKSPECNADRGRSISMPAVRASNDSSCRLFVISLSSADGSSSVGGLWLCATRADAWSGDFLPKPYLKAHVGLSLRFNLSISSPLLRGRSSSSMGDGDWGFECVRLWN